jgi:hypothetical protein
MASMAFFLAPGCCSWFPDVLGTEVDNVQNGSWRRSFAVWLYLAAKPSHVGVDVDGLACPLHCPTACSRQTRDRTSCQAISAHKTPVSCTNMSSKYIK